MRAVAPGLALFLTACSTRPIEIVGCRSDAECGESETCTSTHACVPALCPERREPLLAFTFDDGLVDAHVSYGNPDSLLSDAMVEWEAHEGNPEPGSVHGVAPFTASGQGIQISPVRSGWQMDLAGTTLFARVRLLVGNSADVDAPLKATVIVRTGPDYVYGQGAEVPLWADGEWRMLELVPDAPGYVHPGTEFVPSDARDLAVFLVTQDGREAMSVLLDSLSVCRTLPDE